MSGFQNTIARRALLAAAGVLAAVTSAGTAQAQFLFGIPLYRQHYYQPPVVMEEMTPGEVVASVRQYGFRDASRPVFRDDVALLTATDREGRRLRLMVDLYSGRIVNAVPAPQPRQHLAQRAPDQGAAVRRAVPDVRRDIRAAPETPPPAVRREPILPPQANPPRPSTPRTLPQQAQPPKAQPAPQPPTAQRPAAPPALGTPAQPRRIDITPPAALDDVKPAPAPAPSGPPINSVPVAPLD